VTTLLQVGCANHDRYKPYDKENNDPMPTKYETPFNQTKDPIRNNPAGDQALPHGENGDPTVIEPDPYIPGKTNTLEGIPVKGKAGFVLSPYAPDKGFVDVRGFPVGTDVRDPYTGKIMKVPMPADDGKPRLPAAEADILSSPSLQAPQLESSLPPSPPVLEP
jgi:hypothetical protein